MINVTKTYLPDRKLFDQYVDKIWESGWLTNYGPFVIELEEKLKEYFKVKHLFLINNGTVALQIALRAVSEIKGEIITTPFTYVATTSSIFWEGFKPIFVDINPQTLTIDPSKIEEAITPNTRAILPVHVYGIPCEVEKIEKIARKHNLKVIYDAAHAFGVKYKNNSIVNWGDVSILSFHATKIFNTIEGGAIITHSDEIANKIKYFRNFGHETPTSFGDVGINGKMNEFCAVMGLSVLGSMSDIIRIRKKNVELYDKKLITNHRIRRPTLPDSIEYNYSYYPVIFDSEDIVMKVIGNLNKQDIAPRRYFYPSLDTLSYIHNQVCANSRDISKRILCLPLSHELTKSDINRISSIIINSL